jgi:hypothetical protein
MGVKKCSANLWTEFNRWLTVDQGFCCAENCDVVCSLFEAK